MTHKDELILRAILESLESNGYGVGEYGTKSDVDQAITAITELFDKRFEKCLPEKKMLITEACEEFNSAIDEVKSNWKKESGV